jgi:hypothetical protein
MLPRIGWWGDARPRVAQFLANVWQVPAWPSSARASAPSSGSLYRKRLAPPNALLSSEMVWGESRTKGEASSVMASRSVAGEQLPIEGLWTGSACGMGFEMGRIRSAEATSAGTPTRTIAPVGRSWCGEPVAELLQPGRGVVRRLGERAARHRVVPDDRRTTLEDADETPKGSSAP